MPDNSPPKQIAERVVGLSATVLVLFGCYAQHAGTEAAARLAFGLGAKAGSHTGATVAGASHTIDKDLMAALRRGGSVKFR